MLSRPRAWSATRTALLTIGHGPGGGDPWRSRTPWGGKGEARPDGDQYVCGASRNDAMRASAGGSGVEQNMP